jgi:pyridoxal phosphate enzyme (YggS family)
MNFAAAPAMPDIAEQIVTVHERIASAAARVSRRAETVELVAVSKGFPVEVIREAARAPHDLFGESKVQELLAKAPDLPSKVRWHFVGHLQSNKVRKVLPLVEAIHSVDSLALAQDLERIAAEVGRRPDIFLQVNVGEDAAKYGFTRESVRRDFEALLSLERVNVIGLMTIPPLTEKPEENRRHFASLRELRDELAAASGTPLEGLSMGMSDDYEIAVEEGATVVRVGSAIFGARRLSDKGM